jgi:hypothetical protein
MHRFHRQRNVDVEVLPLTEPFSEKASPKTLNDLLTANCLKYKEIKTCQECRYWEDCNGKKVNILIIKAVREWLTQKQQEAKENQNNALTNETFEYFQEKVIVFQGLLAELEK